MSYISFTAFSQVVGEIVVDVQAEPTAILWIKPQDLPQSPDTNVLQVAVCQCLHICIGLDHLVMLW